jgi:hypothetical protein
MNEDLETGRFPRAGRDLQPSQLMIGGPPSAHASSASSPVRSPPPTTARPPSRRPRRDITRPTNGPFRSSVAGESPPTGGSHTDSAQENPNVGRPNGALVQVTDG